MPKRLRKYRLWISVFLGVGVIVAYGWLGPLAPASLVYANRVIDGDTIEVNGFYRVRYIGIDTPETVHPTKPVQFWGPEASERNKELTEGKFIFLVGDGRNKDDYDRLLRYIYLPNGINVNAQLVVEGHAYYANYGDGFRFQPDFLRLETGARDAKRGLWAMATPSPTVIPTPTPTPTAKPAPTPTPRHPPGATARCRDGTYSYSQNRRGTCSRHGGVAQWLY